MKEPVKIIGLVVFFFVMGMMIGYNMRAQKPQMKAQVINSVVVKVEPIR